MLIIGTDQAETIDGTGSDDEIIGARGNDVVNGNGGNDLIYWRTGTYAVTSDANDFVDGGDGVDRFLVLAGTAIEEVSWGRAGHSYSLQAGANGLVTWMMHTSVAFGWPTFHVENHYATVGLRNVETFSFHAAYGSSWQPVDTIVVGDLRSTALNGLLLFDLGMGRDSLDASAAHNVIVAKGGDGDDLLIGGFANDELIGGADNDTLKGGGGTNTLIGGVGNDVYESDNRFDSVIELAGEGTDNLSTRLLYYVLHDHVEGLTFIGTGDFVGIGNGGDNVIEGGVGNDYLIGFGGNDILKGGAGTDALQGGLGDDSYYVDSTADSTYELAGEGIDTIYSASLVYTLPANIENLREAVPIGNLVWHGNELDNLIVGSAVRDELYGLAGNDTLDAGVGGNNANNLLVGGIGDDTYRIHSPTDQVVELASEGVDTVEIPYAVTHGLPSASNYVLPDNVENLRVLINQNTTMRGNGLDNQMSGWTGRDNLAGEGGNDWLHGNLGNDFLSGGAGNDVLNGGLGADEMSGGTGADIFVFDTYGSGQDLVHDFSRAEGDRVDVSDFLAAVGYNGTDPFADGYLRIVAIPALPPSGAPVTRLQFDADGAAGPATFSDTAIFLGGTSVIGPQDFILV